MAEPTVAAGYAKALLELAVAKGASRRRLIERSRIDPNDLQDQDNRVPLASYMALMRAGKDLCNEPALALQFGAEVDFHAFSIVGLICRSAEMMAEAFAQVNRYRGLVIEVDGTGSGDRFAIVRGPHGLWLVDRRTNPNSFPELTESTFARMICTHARDFGDISFVKAVHVTHTEPAHRAEYDRIFPMQVVFGSDRNALLIDETFLSRKLSPASRYVFGVLSKHAEALLNNLENSKTTRGQVESLLIPILHTGELSMTLVAKELGLSRQSLYR